MSGVYRFYDFAAFCLPCSPPLFVPLWPPLLSFLPLVSFLETCILILLSCPSHQCTSERARAVKIIWG
jgi:hypothetical protein